MQLRTADMSIDRASGTLKKMIRRYVLDHYCITFILFILCFQRAALAMIPRANITWYWILFGALSVSSGDVSKTYNDLSANKFIPCQNVLHRLHSTVQTTVTWHMASGLPSVLHHFILRELPETSHFAKRAARL